MCHQDADGRGLREIRHFELELGSALYLYGGDRELVHLRLVQAVVRVEEHVFLGLREGRGENASRGAVERVLRAAVSVVEPVGGIPVGCVWEEIGIIIS